MPPEIQRITDQFLSAPARVEVAKQSTTAENITQRVVHLPSGNDSLKRATLRKLINDTDVKNGIIFCNRKKNVDIVATSLQKHKLDARPIHGDLPQAYRTETLQKFRDGEIRLLIASDVAARGLDIPDVSHVFNFDVPVNAEDYVHRIGRTGRAGRSGHAYMLVCPSDDKSFAAVLKTTGLEKIEAVEMGDFFEGEQAGGGKSRNTRPSRKDSAEKKRDDQPPAKESRSRPRREKDEPVVGLGDHVPAFLLRDAS